jgi:hypothetical protein
VPDEVLGCSGGPSDQASEREPRFPGMDRYLLVGLLAVVGLLSRSMAKRQREATRRLELHASHLRQVVPSLPR